MILIFDLDGTLGELIVNWEELGKELEKDFGYKIRHEPFWVAKLSTFLITKGYKKEVDKYFSKYEKNCKFIEFPYTKKVLSLPYKKAILSNNTKSTLVRVIKQCSWNIPYFLSRDMLKRPKPWKTGVKKIMSFFGDDKAIMIGNSPTDKETAYNARIPFFCVKPYCDFYSSLLNFIKKV